MLKQFCSMAFTEHWKPLLLQKVFILHFQYLLIAWASSTFVWQQCWIPSDVAFVTLVSTLISLEMQNSPSRKLCLTREYILQSPSINVPITNMLERSYAQANSSVILQIWIHKCAQTQNAHTFKNTFSESERDFKGLLEGNPGRAMCTSPLWARG